MKKSTKAALLSAFIFPGAGHFILKKPLTGLILSATAASAIYVIISKTVENAMRIVEKVQSGEVQTDVAAITDLVNAQTATNDAQGINIAMLVLLAVWIIAIVDAYRSANTSVNTSKS